MAIIKEKRYVIGSTKIWIAASNSIGIARSHTSPSKIPIVTAQKNVSFGEDSFRLDEI